jgi:dephospho-CoA kinase
MSDQQAILIGLTGYAGTGKDTVREVLESHGFTGLAFADPIRQMIRELLASNGISTSYMDDRALKEAIIPELGVSYRQMAQTLGTEWGRNLQPDFWLRLASSFIAQCIADGDTHYVISDVRFLNEAEWVRERGGVIWRVHRAAATPVRPHQSEAEIDHIDADWQIFNNGSFEDVRETVFEALQVTQS